MLKHDDTKANAQASKKYVLSCVHTAKNFLKLCKKNHPNCYKNIKLFYYKYFSVHNLMKNLSSVYDEKKVGVLLLKIVEQGGGQLRVAWD